MPRILVDSCSFAEQILGERWPGLKPVKEYRENGYHVYKLVANCSGSRCPKCGRMCYPPLPANGGKRLMPRCSRMTRQRLFTKSDVFTVRAAAPSPNGWSSWSHGLGLPNR